MSLLGPISQQLLVVSDAATSINYGLNKLRFPGPLPVGAEFRGHGEIVDVTPFDKGVQVTATFTIEVKNPKGVASGVDSLCIDGQSLPTNPAHVALVDDGREHLVEVTLGRGDDLGNWESQVGANQIQR